MIVVITGASAGIGRATALAFAERGWDVAIVARNLPRRAVNTPQFDWALNRTGQKTQPVPPIFQPEVPAQAIVFAAANPHRREIWVGFSTVKAFVGNALMPGLLDRYLAKAGYNGQLPDEPKPWDAPANLFETVNGKFGAHGRFDARARAGSWEMFSSRHRSAVTVSLVSLLFVGMAALARSASRS